MGSDCIVPDHCLSFNFNSKLFDSVVYMDVKGKSAG